MSDSETQLKLPAGDYEFELAQRFGKIESVRFKGIRIEPGVSTAMPVGTLELKGAKLHPFQNIDVYLQEKKVAAFMENLPILKSPAGDYEFELSQRFSKLDTKRFPGVRIVAGETIEAPFSTLELKGLHQFQHINVYHQGKKVGSFCDNPSVLKLPAGNYEFSLVQEFSKLDENRFPGVSMISGERKSAPFGVLKLTGLSGQKVAVVHDGKKVGEMSKDFAKIFLPSGKYTLQFGEYGEQTVTINAGEELDLSITNQ